MVKIKMKAKQRKAKMKGNIETCSQSFSIIIIAQRITTEVRHTSGPVREQVHINRNFIFASSMDDFG